MAHRSVIPFGPQHPVLPEPLHLDLVIEDDRVIEAIPQIGFVHRGLEKLTEKRDMHQFGYIAERICGICAVGHSCGYASACERMLDIEVPGRVQYIRTILHELSRCGWACSPMPLASRRCSIGRGPCASRFSRSSRAPAAAA